MLVVDVSQKGAAFERQLARAEKILSHFQKNRKQFIIVATKREMADPTALEKVSALNCSSFLFHNTYLIINLVL